MTRSGTLRGGQSAPPPQAPGKGGRSPQGDIPLLYGPDPDDDDDDLESDDGMTQVIHNAPFPGRGSGKSAGRAAPPAGRASPPAKAVAEIEETQAGLDEMGVTQMTPALRMPPRKPSLPFVPPSGFTGAPGEAAPPEPRPSPPEPARIAPAAPAAPPAPPLSFGLPPAQVRRPPPAPPASLSFVPSAAPSIPSVLPSIPSVPPSIPSAPPSIPSAPPSISSAPAPGTIGQQFSLRPRPTADTPPGLVEPIALPTSEGGLPAKPELAPVLPAPQRSPEGKTRPLELLWCADGVEPRLRRVPAAATALGAPAQADEQTDKQEVSRRAVHRALARLPAADDLQKVLWDAVDDDGVLTPPIVAVAGELELLTDPAEQVTTLAALARPYAEKDGELVDPLDRALAVAERLPDASDLLAQELSALRRAWSERDVPMPLEDLEAGARRILILKRKLRTLEVFEGKHVAALLRTEAHNHPLPVYLPEAARARLPLEGRFETRLFIELRPRQVEDEASPLAGLVLAIARVVKI